MLMKIRQKAYVYVISVSPVGPCKIGFAKDPWHRHRQVQAGNHCRLELSAVCMPLKRHETVERALHTRFGDKRLHMEWFAVPVVEVVAALAEYGEIQVCPPEPERAMPLMPKDELASVMLAHPRYQA